MIAFLKTKTEKWDRHKFNSSKSILMVLFITLAFAGCYKMKSVNQVSNAAVGSEVTSTFTVEYDGDSRAGTRHAIIGVLTPNDWAIDSVYFDGVFSDNCTFLPAEVADADTGGQIDYWTDSLEVKYPSGSDMQWLVFQSDSGHAAQDTTADITVTVKMTVGQTEGDYDIGYFASDSRMDFTGDTTNYATSLNNSISVTGATSVEDPTSSLPNEYNISQNYPNPFNPSTTISFSLPTESNVVVTLYNILGMKIMTLTNNKYQTGIHQVSFDASGLASGTYIYSIKALGKDGSEFTASKKMILMK